MALCLNNFVIKQTVMMIKNTTSLEKNQRTQQIADIERLNHKSEFITFRADFHKTKQSAYAITISHHAFGRSGTILGQQQPIENQ